MRAGKLNQRVLIQAPPTGQDSGGEPFTVWTDVVTGTSDHKVCAAVNDISGREFMAASATQNEVVTKIEIRYRPGILASMRVVHGTDTYNIEATLRKGQRDLLLMCSRIL